MAYVGGLTPDRGGGVASVISNIVKNTGSKIDYLLLTACNETERSVVQEAYPSNVEIEIVKGTGNFFANVLYYLAKTVDDVDVLHFHDFPLFGRDLPLAVKAYVKKWSLVYSHHIGLEQVVNNELLLGYYHWVLNGSAKMWKKVVANSRFVVDCDLNRFGALRDRICVIKNGVDVEQIRKAKPVKLDGEPSILFVGGLLHRKGIDMLLEAFRTLSSQPIGPDPKLHIVGSGELEKSCKEFVARNGLSAKVRFWGGLLGNSRFGLMRGADMVVVPSRYENASIVLLEAMAAGKPIVATCVGGIPEYLEHGVNGVLVHPSSGQIAMGIKSLCEHSALAERFGKNNEKAAMSFDWKNIARSYVDLYESIQD